MLSALRVMALTRNRPVCRRDATTEEPCLLVACTTTMIGFAVVMSPTRWSMADPNPSHLKDGKNAKPQHSALLTGPLWVRNPYPRRAERIKSSSRALRDTL